MFGRTNIRPVNGLYVHITQKPCGLLETGGEWGREWEPQAFPVHTAPAELWFTVQHMDLHIRRPSDRITKLVLEFTDVLLPVFQKITNLSLTKVFKKKKAVVKPLIKKEKKKKPDLDPEVLGNYRPVSNLPYLSKILERAVAGQLQAHLNTNGLHVKFQSAYRRGHSTETALLRILNDLLVMIDGGNNAVLVLLDLSAAFDTLDHTLLLQRLHAEIGLDGSALDWFSAYLSCRSQQVLVGHALSAETPLLCGVPHGSVLGPLLFSLYTRQLADLIDKFCIDYHFFADDSELLLFSL